MKLSAFNILTVMEHPKVFGRQFKGDSWRRWKVFLAALFGLPLTVEQRPLFRKHTGRQSPPIKQAREAAVIVGRRGGKSFISALVLVFLACFRNYKLAPGEKGVVMCISADRRQAKVVFNFCWGLIDSVPMLAGMVVNKTSDSIELNNGVNVEVHTASFRAVRGYTIVAVVCDELAFWRSDDSANPDTEILNGIRPGMASIPNALLLSISSPYARRGELWKSFRAHYGKNNDPVLVWQASTTAMNPTVDKGIIRAAYEADEAAARSEYGAEFRRDLEAFVSQEVIDAVVVEGRHELPWVPEIFYQAFVDPSGGSQDSMTLAISHHENGRAILDCVREVVPPFSPDAVAKEFADTIKGYRINSCQGDRYGGMWPRERFAVHGVDYQISPKTKSEIYLAALPAFNSGKVELLDTKRLISQLQNLERKTSRGGRDSIDHGAGLHDDIANAACGSVVMALEQTPIDISGIEVFGDLPVWRGEDSVINENGPQKTLSERIDALVDGGGGRNKLDW